MPLAQITSFMDFMGNSEKSKDSVQIKQVFQSFEFDLLDFRCTSSFCSLINVLLP